LIESEIEKAGIGVVLWPGREGDRW